MDDVLHTIPFTHLAATLARVLGVPAPAGAAPSLDYLDVSLARLAGRPFDRVVMYHSDAIPMYVFQRYTHLFTPIFPHVQVAVPFRSTDESSCTPVAHATMYTGLTPPQHGITTYVRPQLACETLYDTLIAAGRKPAIVAMPDSTFLNIFTGRDMDYFEAPDGEAARDITLRLIAEDRYDLISVHSFEYDSAAHRHGPESPEALEAAAFEAACFARIADALEQQRMRHTILLGYAPDHGQHAVTDDKGNVHGEHGSMLPEDMNVMHFYGVKCATCPADPAPRLRDAQAAAPDAGVARTEFRHDV